MTRKTIRIITIALVALFAYVLGAYVGVPFSEGNFQGGDIAKVKRHNTPVVKDQADSYREMMLADTVKKKSVLVSLSLMSAQMEEFNSLVKSVSSLSEAYPELQSQISAMVAVTEASGNAAEMTGKVRKSFAAMEDINDKDIVSLEQDVKNAMFSYMYMSRYVSLGKDFVEAADACLVGKDVASHEALADARDAWAAYCAFNAWVENDRSEQKYWSEKGAVASDNELALIGLQTIADSELFDMDMLGLRHPDMNNTEILDQEMLGLLGAYADVSFGGGEVWDSYGHGNSGYGDSEDDSDSEDESDEDSGEDDDSGNEE